MMTLSTPKRFQISLDGASVIDHGVELVHELGGKPRNYLQTVSIPDDDIQGNCGMRRLARLSDFGFKCQSGYRNRDTQYWVYVRQLSLQDVDLA